MCARSTGRSTRGSMTTTGVNCATGRRGQDATTQAVADLNEQLALVNARITGLGTPTPGEVEAPELVAQRKALSTLRSTLDAAIKRGRLAGVEAGQLIDEIDQSKAAQFNEKLSSKAPSPLSPAF